MYTHLSDGDAVQHTKTFDQHPRECDPQEGSAHIPLEERNLKG